MTTEAQVTVNGKPPQEALSKVSKRLDQRRKKVQETGGPMHRASIYLDRWVQKNFKTEGGNVGGWLPFAFGGRLTGKGIDTSAKLLQDTGRLRASFTPFHTKTNAGVFSDLPYARKHNEGEGRVPQRRMLPKAAEVMDDIKRILVNFVRVSIK